MEEKRGVVEMQMMHTRQIHFKALCSSARSASSSYTAKSVPTRSSSTLPSSHETWCSLGRRCSSSCSLLPTAKSRSASHSRYLVLYVINVVICSQTNNICRAWNHFHRKHGHGGSDEAKQAAAKETEAPLLGNEVGLGEVGDKNKDEASSPEDKEERE